MATMRLSRLVTSSSTNPTSKASRNTQTQGVEPPPVYAKQKELENLRIESELKTKQLLELRKEVLVLQSKLKEVMLPPSLQNLCSSTRSMQKNLQKCVMRK